MCNYRLLHDKRLVEHRCDHCGVWFTEGWSLLELNAHACSDECALAVYEANGQGREEFQYDIENNLAGWYETIF